MFTTVRVSLLLNNLAVTRNVVPQGCSSYCYWNSHITIGAKVITLHNFIVRIRFPDYIKICLHNRIGFGLFLGYVVSCVVAKHTMWTSDYIT